MFHFGEHLLNPSLIGHGPAVLCRHLNSRDIVARGLGTIRFGRRRDSCVVGLRRLACTTDVRRALRSGGTSYSPLTLEEFLR